MLKKDKHGLADQCVEPQQFIEVVDISCLSSWYNSCSNVFLYSEPGTYKLMWFDSFLQVWEGDRLAKCINVVNLKKKHRKIDEDGIIK